MCASCLKLEGIIGQLKGQLRRYGLVSGQNTSCERVVDSHFDELTVPFFLMKTYNQCLVSFSNFEPLRIVSAIFMMMITFAMDKEE